MVDFVVDGAGLDCCDFCGFQVHVFVAACFHGFGVCCCRCAGNGFFGLHAFEDPDVFGFFVAEGEQDEEDGVEDAHCRVAGSPAVDGGLVACCHGGEEALVSLVEKRRDLRIKETYSYHNHGHINSIHPATMMHEKQIRNL